MANHVHHDDQKSIRQWVVGMITNIHPLGLIKMSLSVSNHHHEHQALP